MSYATLAAPFLPTPPMGAVRVPDAIAVRHGAGDGALHASVRRAGPPLRPYDPAMTSLPRKRQIQIDLLMEPTNAAPAEEAKLRALEEQLLQATLAWMNSQNSPPTCLAMAFVGPTLIRSSPMPHDRRS
jgi:hypothetical protein